MKAIDPRTLPARTGSAYPPPFDEPVRNREKRALGDPFGLQNFGANLVRLPPGTESSQRHWHSRQDELVMVMEGELVLVTDDGEQTMTPGTVAGFPAGTPDGHKLVNRSSQDAVYLEIGDRMPGDASTYSDIDMRSLASEGARRFIHKDGTPY